MRRFLNAMMCKGFVDGKVVFMPENEEITRDFLEGIAGKIPKPCSFKPI